MKPVNYILLIGGALSLAACHTSEENYKAAYDIAKQKERDGLDDQTYELIQEEKESQFSIVGNDTVKTETEHFAIVENDDTTVVVKKYNVAVGKYKMLVNAKAHRNRMRSNGFDSFLLMTGTPVYYVVIGTFDTLEEAALMSGKFEKEHPGQFVGMTRPTIAIKAQTRLNR